MADKGPYANMRSGRFSIPKFTTLPSDLEAMRNMSPSEKDAYAERKLLEHKRALFQEFEVNRQQAIIESLVARCFNHCIQKPGPKMTTGQKRCVADCTDNMLGYQTAMMAMLVERAKRNKKPYGPPIGER
mmetsp:Transcript_13678/g.33462  ORF Transcript_13678/g.33462 Transcript_13678/m.33462 type:complete len:130 (-) Transcript_13678:321-710(-)|eukprot:CAMPEP_0114519036 /NCGR_PEP_ID=MMETSP0109-20121206/18777_1 /TAXON_ID=29199 /ORGANISM="Chlorarachnion reptans, Strain CCCM449" /LENGTH=129 /DNA_ID=CAMNT_0001699725 /DNA_START=79 /DNA_END=468 /DNA_ORIENTATION=-